MVSLCTIIICIIHSSDLVSSEQILIWRASGASWIILTILFPRSCWAANCMVEVRGLRWKMPNWHWFIHMICFLCPVADTRVPWSVYDSSSYYYLVTAQTYSDRLTPDSNWQAGWFQKNQKPTSNAHRILTSLWSFQHLISTLKINFWPLWLFCGASNTRVFWWEHIPNMVDLIYVSWAKIMYQDVLAFHLIAKVFLCCKPICY